MLINQDQLRTILKAFSDVNGLNSQAFVLEQDGIGAVIASFRFSIHSKHDDKYTHKRTIRVNRYGLITEGKTEKLS